MHASAFWSIDSAVVFSSDFNDNPRLLKGTSETNWNSQVDIQVPVSNRTARGTLALEPLFRVAYSSFDNRYRLEQIARANGTYAVGRKSKFAINGQFSRETAVTAELEQTGIVQSSLWRDNWTVSPTITQMISDRSAVQYNLTYRTTTYQGSAPYLTDFASYTAAVTDSYNMNPLESFTASAAVSRFSANGSLTDSFSIQLGIDKTLSPLLKGTASAGLSKSKIAGIGPTYDSALLSFGLTKKGVRVSASIAASRSIDDAGTGSLLRRDQVSFTVNRKLTKYLSAAIALSESQYVAIDKRTPIAGRDYGRVDINVSSGFTKNWSVGMGYSHVEQSFTSVSLSGASANLILVRISYVTQ